MARTVKRAFKFRFYPTDAQAALLLRTFGCVRFVYNHALAERVRAYRVEGRPMSYGDMSAALTAWKRTPEMAFLNAVSSVPLQQALRHLHAAFTAFFAGRAGHPVYKSKKRSRASAEYTRSAFRWRDGRLILARMDAPLDIVWSRPLPEGTEPSTVTVSRDRAGRWFVSILVEDRVAELAPNGRAIGIDMGLQSLATLSTGEKIAGLRNERTDAVRLARLRRSMARKVKGSANHGKARLKVARAHARIADRRRDHLHKITTRIVRENQTVVIEDLPVRNLLGNHNLAGAISAASWRQMRDMLVYKAAWYGRELIVVDRWFPSSKTCSHCGAVRECLPLAIRSWECACGAVHDRDVNAARNILAAGPAERVNACGGPVRPSPRKRTRRGSKKQESLPVRAGIFWCEPR
ncbi:putative transposase [Thermocatellispora tengchongensis]|uniref:Putative transposase n=1 Tax=Thermocatellispora tengchongensis TaxID=1073253 RepID=A0A840PCM8_9ACTN|nr:RNA-guided endonuclease TnpB family protein [Thermocatellispora tengchongensis]MBB5134927.1 putative transposase [Thermocatellispora tengchongensis]